MVIGIDASRAVKPQRTGTENYSWEVIRRLVTLRDDIIFRLYAPHLPIEPFPEVKNVEWRILPQQRLWTQRALAKELRKSPPDLLFVPSHALPFWLNAPSVTMIHDLACRLYPEAYSLFDRQYIDLVIRLAVKKTCRILVPSTQSKIDLKKFYDIENKDITVTPLGVREVDYHGEAPLKKPYFLSIGRIEARKNTLTLVEAFSQLAQKYPEPELVLIGKPGYQAEAVSSKIESLPEAIRKRIHQLGYQSDEIADKYLCHCLAFVYPTLYEGFGMPVLEAFAAGAPVITSDCSSIPEVAGDAALLVKPTDPHAIAEAMERVLNTPSLGAELREKGKKQVTNFSWDKTAKQTMDVLLECLPN